MASQGMGAPPTPNRGAHMHNPRCASAPVSSLLSTKGAYLSLTFLGCFAPFGGIISPSSPSYAFLFFFFKSRQGSSPSAVIKGGGGGRLEGTLVLGNSFEGDPLFRLANKPFKVDLYFKSIPSSSSELVSTQATMKNEKQKTYPKWPQSSRALPTFLALQLPPQDGIG